VVAGGTAVTDQQFWDFVTFGRHLVATKDIDPIYPLIKWVIQDRRLDDEQAHWLVYLYLCAYNAPTAWAIFQEFNDPHFYSASVTESFKKWEAERRPRLRINIERRGLRGGKIVEALEAYSCLVAGVPQRGWLETADGWLERDSKEAFSRLWNHVQMVPFVGRWAAFKWLDLLKHVLDYPIEFPDMRLAYCTGPRQALEELYLGARSDRQDGPYIEWLDGVGKGLRTQVGSAGLSLTFDELETALCNFLSTMHGRYYIGHDIDECQGDLEVWSGALADDLQAVWWSARQSVLDHRLLGEYNGWHGVRKDLCRLYKEQGIIHVGGK